MRLWSYSVLPETKVSTNGGNLLHFKSALKPGFQVETCAFHKLDKKSEICLNGTGHSKGEDNFSSPSWFDEQSSEGKKRNFKI